MPAVRRALLLGFAVGAATPPTQQPQRVNAERGDLAGFIKRVDGYVALHKKLEDTLPEAAEADRPRTRSTSTSARWRS